MSSHRHAAHMHWQLLLTTERSMAACMSHAAAARHTLCCSRLHQHLLSLTPRRGEGDIVPLLKGRGGQGHALQHPLLPPLPATPAAVAAGKAVEPGRRWLLVMVQPVLLAVKTEPSLSHALLAAAPVLVCRCSPGPPVLPPPAAAAAPAWVQADV